MIEGQWYQIEDGTSYQVDNSVITVRFKEVDQSEIDYLNESMEVGVIRVNGLGFYDLLIQPESDPLEMVQSYLESEIVEVAEPNTIGEYFGNPNDPYFSNQWFHYNTQVDHDIDSPEAWDWETGSSEVIIGLLDSGIDFLHEDLQGNIWVNPGEDIDGDGVVGGYGSPAQGGDENGVDDDGNGYIDDLMGWEFLPSHPGTNNIQDYLGHGTHVGGVAAAVTNNNTGVAGVAGGWYSSDAGTKILTCVVGDIIGIYGPIVDDAILYAADEGVDIITMSFGVGENSAINAALQYAHQTKGCFIDAASGNTANPNATQVRYPARNQYVFAVGATHYGNPGRPVTSENRQAGFPGNPDSISFEDWSSCYGSNLDVVAPGVDIFSTQLDINNHDDYGYWSGTSFAAPQVAAIAALLKAKDPSYTNSDIEMIIATSTEKVGNYSYNQTKQYGAWDNEMGYGRVNAFYAVAPPSAPQNLTTSIEDPQGDAHPRIDWDRNEEPDLEIYEIWKKPHNQNWNLYDTTTDTFYVDEGETGAGPLPCANCSTIYYKIRAVDFAVNQSDFSSSVSFHFDGEDPENVVGIDNEERGLIPDQLTLIQNYPNPFNPETVIRFRLPRDENATLTIYSITGEEVITLAEGYFEKGYHEVIWDGSNTAGNIVSSGPYIYLFPAGNQRLVKKMILLR